MALIDARKFASRFVGEVFEYDFEDYDPNYFSRLTGATISRTTFERLWSKISLSVTALVPATDRVNITAHGRVAGNLVKFSFTGGGITTGTFYYVINPTTDDFQISLTPGGSAVDLTSTQTGTCLTHVQYGFGDGSTTFNLPDRRGVFTRNASSHGSRAKAAGGNYDGGAVGFEGQDKLQGSRHLTGVGFTSDNGTLYGSSNTDVPGPATAFVNLTGGIPDRQYFTSGPISDGVNGTPRTGNETAPAWTAVNMLVRIR